MKSKKCEYCGKYPIYTQAHFNNCVEKQNVKESNKYIYKTSVKEFITPAGMVALVLRDQLSDEDWVKQQKSWARKWKRSEDVKATIEFLTWEKEKGIEFRHNKFNDKVESFEKKGLPRGRTK